MTSYETTQFFQKFQMSAASDALTWFIKKFELEKDVAESLDIEEETSVEDLLVPILKAYKKANKVVKKEKKPRAKKVVKPEHRCVAIKADGEQCGMPKWTNEEKSKDFDLCRIHNQHAPEKRTDGKACPKKEKKTKKTKKTTKTKKEEKEEKSENESGSGSESDSEDEDTGCEAKIASGKRKGQACGANTGEGSKYCKRHAKAKKAKEEKEELEKELEEVWNESE